MRSQYRLRALFAGFAPSLKIGAVGDIGGFKWQESENSAWFWEEIEGGNAGFVVKVSDGI